MGGSAADTGEMFLVNYTLKSLTIKGSIVGGAGARSGLIKSYNLGPCYIGGSIIGGTGNNSGGLNAFGFSVATIFVNGDIKGGDVTQEGVTLTNSGFIDGDASGTVTVHGSLIGGTNDTTTGKTKVNGSIVLGDATSVIIGGNVTGNVGSGGQKTAPAILGGPSSLSIGGDVINALIGYGVYPSDDYKESIAYPLTIGTITIGGNFTASNISVGVGAGADLEFGTSDDALKAASIGEAYAGIASIIIKGNLTGTVGGTDSFGIQAERIGKLSVHGVAVNLAAGQSNDDILTGDSGDVRVRELTRVII